MDSFREFEPHPALAAFVDRFWTHAGSAQDHSAPSRILPDGCIDLVVDLRDGSSEIVGTMTQAAVLSLLAEPARLVGVRFRPGGANPFLRIDAYELTDRVVDVRDFGARWLNTLRIAEDYAATVDVNVNVHVDAPLSVAALVNGNDTVDVIATPGRSNLDDPARFLHHTQSQLLDAVAMLQRALLSRLPEISAPDRSVAHAVSALFAPTPPAIDALARELGCSRQHLRRTLRNHVGLPPVQLARVARLQRAVVALQEREDPNLADAALRLGYYDQAHLNRDFRDLAGLTPRQAAADGSIFPIRSLLRLHDAARK